MNDTAEQHKKQYDWLKGYQFVKGESGNPTGRPRGRKSMKTFAREFLESLPDDEKIDFISTLPPDIVWKMAEGNPESKTDITTAGKPIIQVAEELIKKHDLNPRPEGNSEG